ncbi:hypothetical protein LCGC14_2796760 [marine sediment metagenome]|uniref:Uncharacterized protein n=1 Tax=marine sediment metagenome TaxID=412755 RepID=A0A0F9BFB7_9ZZZZ
MKNTNGKLRGVNICSSEYVKMLQMLTPQLFDRYMYGTWTTEQALQLRLRMKRKSSKMLVCSIPYSFGDTYALKVSRW